MKAAVAAPPRAKSPPSPAAVKAKKKAPAAADCPALSPEQRHAMIATAAYFRAERRSFVGAAEVDDWLAAEAEIDRTLAAACRA